MMYMGIDPGKAGALALINDKRQIICLEGFNRDEYMACMRDAAGLEDMIAACCLEQVGAMPGNGGKSMFSFGENFGWIQGVLDSFNVRYQLIPPKRWKHEFGLDSDKNKSIEVCKHLFPEVSLKRSPGSRKDDDGLAEALLMAEYARRKL